MRLLFRSDCRPTIRYHAEGCCFFLCNAWELMLKGYVIREMGYEAVYYPNSDRTLSLSDPLNKYIYRTKKGTEFIRRKLSKEGITLLVKGEPKEFNDFHFRVFVDFYNMKGNDAYSYNLSLGDERPSWGYSQQAVDLMLQQIRRDPEHVIDSMRVKLSKRKSKEKEGH